MFLLFKACRKPLRMSPRKCGGKHLQPELGVPIHVISCVIFEFQATAQWNSHCLKENLKNSKNLKKVKVTSLPHCHEFEGS